VSVTASIWPLVAMIGVPLLTAGLVLTTHDRHPCG
jgi:hypothetical protein